MKYCSNCGSEINENAVVCLSCGAAVNRDINSHSNYRGEQGSRVSMILGIIAVVFASISLFISFCVFMSYQIEGPVSSQELMSLKYCMYILTIPVPSILSVIGLILGLYDRAKTGYKVAGISLNIASLVILIINFITIAVI